MLTVFEKIAVFKFLLHKDTRPASLTLIITQTREEVVLVAVDGVEEVGKVISFSSQTPSLISWGNVPRK